jgi:hypothetical protein
VSWISSIMLAVMYAGGELEDGIVHHSQKCTC